MQRVVYRCIYRQTCSRQFIEDLIKSGSKLLAYHVSLPTASQTLRWCDCYSNQLVNQGFDHSKVLSSYFGRHAPPKNTIRESSILASAEDHAAQHIEVIYQCKCHTNQEQ